MIETLCHCGRPLTPRHCVNCGRKDIYSIKRADRLVVVEGQKFIARGFRCRKCGVEFDESTPCDTPKRGLSITAQRVGDQVTNSLSGLPQPERMAKLAEMF